MQPLTIGIATRNRPEALRRCVASIRNVLGSSDWTVEVIVFDDNSTVPAAEQLGGMSTDLRVIRDVGGVGPIVGRNTLVQEAAHEIVLLLDDDAALLEASSVEKAIAVMERDPSVAAIAFA